MEKFFVKAKPIWSESLDNEKNITLGLYKQIVNDGQEVVLTVATSGVYRVFVNGEFFHFGPARCAHGYFRVDRLPLDLRKGNNDIAIEVLSHNVNSFYIPLQSSFIQAEISINKKVLASTGDDSFKLLRLNERIRKVQRYSFQRPFAEAYNLDSDCYGWRIGVFGENITFIKSVIKEQQKLIERNLLLNNFTTVKPEYIVGYGDVNLNIKPKEYRKDRSLIHILDPNFGNLQGYYEEELELHLSDEVQEFSTCNLNKIIDKYEGETNLNSKEFEIISFPCEKTGFITAQIECATDGSIYFLVDEILNENGDVDPLRMECCNAIKLNVKKGVIDFVSFEPMAFKYLKILCVSGSFSIRNIHIIETVCPQPIKYSFNSKDEQLNEILCAARETFIQNSFDMFMDCPSRERAGWLCDSYFLGIAEYEYTGKNIIEKNFLENYLLPNSYKNIPKGMVPMCYPSDQESDGFIPNWALWLILELELYSERSDKEKILVNNFKDKIYGILDWFKSFENEDGLLEKLTGWVFVEWSKANDFVQDINYPSNMLYARALEAVSNLYKDNELLAKSDALKKKIRERAFDGEFFIDNEVYCNGELQKTKNRTETCQYYAFFTGVATPELYPDLWNKLVNEFGPERKKNNLYPEIHHSNAFIGNILRLTLLLNEGYCKQLLNEIKGYYLYMARTTGTLWEHIDTCASCNHGFASYVAYLIRYAEQNITNY